MKISRTWLERYFDAPLPDASALAHALTFHAFEIESVEGDILDVKVTPNRGHDCLSHRGIAKELSAILELPLKRDPLREPIVLEPRTDKVEISIAEPALCRRYIAGYIRGVNVKPSPEWLVRALESVGQRSINNVVDATNFVMFGIGQPLHAFDAGKLSLRGDTYAINVRKAKSGERIIALDSKEYECTDQMLLITDAHSEMPIGIAGVKGGAPAAINEETTDIIIESANFDGVSVRRTAAALKLRTDASARFEQQVSPEVAGYGMQEVAALILELAGGELVGFAEHYPSRAAEMRASVTTAQVNSTLGTDLSDEDVAQVLTRLDLPHKRSKDRFDVIAPPERLDIAISEDLIEEVARIEGYDRIPSVELAPLAEPPAISKNFYWQERIREFLVGRGCSEVFTPVFSTKGEKAVLNKVDSDTPYLRDSLVPGVSEALERNVRTKELLALGQVRIFELGTVWRGGKEYTELAIGVEQLKKHHGAVELGKELSDFLGVEVNATSPVFSLSFSDLVERLPEPEHYDVLPNSLATRYQAFSRYPFIVRDISMWIEDSDIARGTVLSILGNCGQGLLRNVILFDQFKKDDKTSLGFRLVFQSFERTLTDDDANRIMLEITTAITERGWQVR